MPLSLNFPSPLATGGVLDEVAREDALLPTAHALQDLGPGNRGRGGEDGEGGNSGLRCWCFQVEAEKESE